MPDVYARDLDLNLLRVFAVVSETGSATEAAKRLYLTQPAVSAALRRLRVAIGAPLFISTGRGLALTARGARLRAGIDSHLGQLVASALDRPSFDPRTCERTVRLGLADSLETWLLPHLMRILDAEAPGIRIAVVPVQFRTIATELASRVEIALTVADPLPATIRRVSVLTGGFVCLYDPRHAKLRRTLTEAVYFAHDHVVVGYNGDLRGHVEDSLGKQRNVRCAVASFASVGALVDGTARLATVSSIAAASIRESRPHLRTKPLPFELPTGSADLLWPATTDDDEALRYLRDTIIALCKRLNR